MASFNVYTYRWAVPSTDDIDTIKHLIEGGINATLGANGVTTTFLYDREERLLHTTTYTGTITPIFRRPIDLVTFIEFIKSSKCILDVKTRIDHDTLKPVEVSEVVNYPVMITDLENLKLIETRPTSSVMAWDDRKFRFIGEDVFYDVDCLGTRLCSDISERIKNIWIGRNTLKRS
jgi:hypothetical protein